MSMVTAIPVFGAASVLSCACLNNAQLLSAADIETIMAAAKVDEEQAEKMKDQAAIIAASGLLEEMQEQESAGEDQGEDSGETVAEDSTTAGDEPAEK